MSGIYVGTSSGMKELKIGKEEVHGEQIFTESGTFTVPEGVAKIDVFLVGGGSSIGISNGTASVTNGNAWITFGVAGCAKTIFGIPVNPGDSHQISIGTGGEYINNSGTDYALANNYSNSNYNWYFQAIHPGGDTKFDDYVAKGGGNVFGQSSNFSLWSNTTSNTIDKYIITGSRCTNVVCYGITNFEKQTISVNPSMILSDTVHAFGNINKTEYCKLDASSAGSCGTAGTGQSVDDGYFLYIKNASGKDGICIVRW